jgi:hypothetical protein
MIAGDLSTAEIEFYQAGSVLQIHQPSTANLRAIQVQLFEVKQFTQTYQPGITNKRTI